MAIAGKMLLASSLIVCCATAAAAQSADRYDRKLERATAARVSAKLGALRGAIRPDVRDYLYSENSAPRKSLPGFPIILEKPAEEEGSSLPPLVMVEPIASIEKPAPRRL